MAANKTVNESAGVSFAFGLKMMTKTSVTASPLAATNSSRAKRQS